MNCKYCSAEIAEGKKFCGECGKSVDEVVNINNNTETTTNTTANAQNNAQNAGGNTKVYKILSYIGILWLVGLFVKEKDDKSVRFHVGQGIIATICIAILYLGVFLINTFIISNVFVTELKVWGVSMGKTVSGTGLAIMGFLNFAVFAIAVTLEIIGIVNAAKDQDKELPVIGSRAFYK